jgi:hypothetical protein
MINNQSNVLRKICGILVVLFINCNSNENRNRINTFECFINGSVWRNEGFNVNFHNHNGNLYCKLISSKKDRENDFIEIYAGSYLKNKKFQELIITFSTKFIKEGEFHLNKWYQDSTEDFKYLYFMDHLGKKNYNHFGTVPPTIKILAYDSTARTISGEFSAILLRDTELLDSLIISHGRFDLKFD